MLAERSSLIQVANVESNPTICREHFRLTLRCEQFPDALPGQFVHLVHPQHAHQPCTIEWHDDQVPSTLLKPTEADDDILIRRAFSIAGLRRQADCVEIDVIYRVVGKATRWMSHLKHGDTVNVLGPVGNHFEIQPQQTHAILVGGGVGLPPMLWLAEHLQKQAIQSVAFIGAQTKELLALTIKPDATLARADNLSPVQAAIEFAEHNTPVIISTDDGSSGFRGFVTDALQQYLNQHSVPVESTVVYCCGPEVMMHKVAQLCETKQLACQLCMERSMACGMGTCQSCVVPIHDTTAPDQWRYQLCCTHGPVFNRESVIWM